VIYTSGTWVLGDTVDVVTEDAPVAPTPLVAWRPAHESIVLRRSRGRRVRTIVLRPGNVYGGARGIVGDLLRESRRGLIRVVGDGKNRWSCVYRADLADLYLRLAADAEATGIYHATGGASERVIDIVEAIADHHATRPDIRLVPLIEARATMGAHADALALDQQVDSPRARALGWRPVLTSVAGSLTRLFEEFRRGSEAVA
jgi:nucleoside-diphosphate-sugar epimerase